MLTLPCSYRAQGTYRGFDTSSQKMVAMHSTFGTDQILIKHWDLDRRELADPLPPVSQLWRTPEQIFLGESLPAGYRIVHDPLPGIPIEINGSTRPAMAQYYEKLHNGALRDDRLPTAKSVWLWKAFVRCYREAIGEITSMDTDENIPDKFSVPAQQYSVMHSRRQYWRYWMMWTQHMLHSPSGADVEAILTSSSCDDG